MRASLYKGLVCGLGLMAAAPLALATETGEIHVYRDSAGTRLFTDRKAVFADYAYVGKYGRPTAVLSCQGLTPASLEARGQLYSDLIDKYARLYGVDAALVKAVMRVESCFDRKARSRVGARGLMQLMPATAKELGVTDSYNAAQNIRGGVQYLGWLLKRFNGDLRLAAAGYNAGEGAVDKYKGVPPYSETQRYVQRVAVLADRYRNAGSSTTVTASAASGVAGAR